MTISKTLAVAILAIGHTMSASADGFKSLDDVQSVTGTFRSAAPEPWYGGYGVREFVMADGTWSLIFTHAMDPGMTQRTFQYRAGGPYNLLAESPDVPGAYQGQFGYSWKHVTMLTDNVDLQQAYGLSECGLTVNLEADISTSGCGHWRPVAECAADYDLLALDDDGIYFGVRAADNDMCTADKTPKALLPVVANYGG